MVDFYDCDRIYGYDKVVMVVTVPLWMAPVLVTEDVHQMLVPQQINQLLYDLYTVHGGAVIKNVFRCFFNKNKKLYRNEM